MAEGPGTRVHSLQFMVEAAATGYGTASSPPGLECRLRCEGGL